ncbi:MAG TPA: Rieske 2Fe-2S domain-containing protein [Chloroflexota bacterium]|nr:Rieske 2Fe-2S domain-containing protein [Chloroflexota bacterium]
MLSKEHTELLCRVGSGTPMGSLMREYWLPATYAWELERDGKALRVRILGEDLLAWRDTNGNPGFIAENCPHRGASLFYARNEECGIRCVYHGWKFDVSGNCVDMPNEPAESNFREKIKPLTYRGADWGGITWIYMGPRQENPPGLPEWEWCMVPENQVLHSHKGVYECNYMQALEGELDTTHVYFLHSRLDPGASPSYGLYVRDKRARLEIMDTNYGVMYGARRQEDEDYFYWRSTQFLFPIYGMFPGGGEDGTVPLSIYLPIDDTHTLHWGLWWHPSQALPRSGTRPTAVTFNDTGQLIGGVGPLKPEQKGRFFADWWPEACKDNDFMVNWDVKRSKSFTGIASVRLQDDTVITSMGPIMKRWQDHLGTADATIIRVRRRMLDAAEAFAERGVLPPGVDHPEFYRVRSCQAILPSDVDWRAAMDDWHHARTPDHPTGGFSPQREFVEGGAGLRRQLGN